MLSETMRDSSRIVYGFLRNPTAPASRTPWMESFDAYPEEINIGTVESIAWIRRRLSGPSMPVRGPTRFAKAPYGGGTCGFPGSGTYARSGWGQAPSAARLRVITT